MTPEQNDYFMQSLWSLINASENGKLTAQQMRSGLLLLWMAQSTNGYLNLSHVEAGFVCYTKSNDTMRAHLIALNKAKVLSDYSTNGTVRIKFAAYPGREMITHRRQSSSPDEQSSSPDEQLSDNDYYNCSSDARHRALYELLRASHKHHSRNFDGFAQNSSSMLVSKLDQTPTPDQVTNKLTATPTTKTDPVEHALSVTLMEAAGIWPKTAKQLADRHPFDLIRRAVGHWWCNRRSQGGQFDERPGIVITWLTNLEETVIPPLSAEFMASTLYLNHRRKSEMIVDDDAIETDDELDTTQIDWPEMHEYWAVALERMRQKLPAGTFNTWLEGSVAEFDDQRYTCTVVVDSVTKRDFLQANLRQMISREINQSTGYKLTLSIEARRRS